MFLILVKMSLFNTYHYIDRYRVIGLRLRKRNNKVGFEITNI